MIYNENEDELGKETEKKFLVDQSLWQDSPDAAKVIQGYIYISEEKTVRVRTSGGKGFLTIKMSLTKLTRSEYEYEIPINEAEEIISNICEKPVIRKIRSTITVGEHVWEVDRFLDDNEGLIVAEVELDREDSNPELPHWVGKEVSDDPRFFNSNLVKNPFSTFREDFSSGK